MSSLIQYRPVPQKFRKDQFDFETAKRQGDVALLKKTKGNFLGYEVVVIQKHDGYEMMGQVVPPSEFYPNSESWGIHGFSYTRDDLEGAERRFQLLVGIKSIPKEIGKPKLSIRKEAAKIKLKLKSR